MSFFQRILRAVRRLPGASHLQFLIPDRVVTREVSNLGLFSFRLRRHRWMLGKNLFVGGHHAQTLAEFRQLISPSDVVYDIGANVGYYTRFIARDMKAGRVIAFEPMRENADLLENNVKLGGHTDIVRVFRVALSDHEGEESLQVDDVMGGTAVLDQVAGGKASDARQHVGLGPKTETVRVVRLDDLVARENLPPPNFMKIDTEGAEGFVLAGAMETLRRHKPKLAIALHGEVPALAVISALSSLGYTIKGRVESDALRVITIDDAGRLKDNNIVAT